jgi:hypothetical protein
MRKLQKKFMSLQAEVSEGGGGSFPSSKWENVFMLLVRKIKVL